MVTQVCQFMHKPNTTYWQVVKRILRYLDGTIIHGLRFRHGTIFSLHGFPNVDLVANPNDRHLVSGFVIFLSPNPIFWSSKMQRTVV